jgi:AraC-like DNA-binding protein
MRATKVHVQRAMLRRFRRLARLAREETDRFGCEPDADPLSASTQELETGDENDSRFSDDAGPRRMRHDCVRRHRRTLLRYLATRQAPPRGDPAWAIVDLRQTDRGAFMDIHSETRDTRSTSVARRRNGTLPAVVGYLGGTCATTSRATSPEGARSDHDVLAETLRAVRLTGSVFLNARFSAPFGVISPQQFDAGTPMAHLRHISIFHLISAGSCTIEIATGERRTVSAGDILLVPFAAAHTFWDGECAEKAFAPDLLRPGPVKGLWTINHGGGGRTTRMVCGFIESSEFLFAPVFRSLPPLLVDRTGDDKVSALLTSTVREILGLADTAAPGTELMLGRLMELLFVEVLRRYAARLPPSATGWFAALNDPVVSRALQFVHGDPARRWTVDDLAREAGASRTVLAERFNAVMGRAPIEYVTGWRMQLAAERIRNSNDSLAAISADIGYESEAAFNRAFKRVTGVTPGRWRDGASQAAP